MAGKRGDDLKIAKYGYKGKDVNLNQKSYNQPDLAPAKTNQNMILVRVFIVILVDRN